ncbi:MAG: HAMP domain-containing sensor histidine kinase [Planctomycetota bacterium]|nr:HAMP domain-containing sensor histidine kinase [Planctomycetota bacterium]
MGLLPCLRFGSDRWWLPRNTEVGEVLGKIFLAHARGAAVDQSTRRQLLQTLQADPPLMLFTSLNLLNADATLPHLADWLIEHACESFTRGDAFLGAPEPTPERRARWRELRDYFRTLPIEQWLGKAELWLQVTGPPAPQPWRIGWPVISGESTEFANLTSEESDGGCLLQQLARLAERHRTLEQTFDEELHQSKLNALKQLAYGLSHEINNPLANISTRAQQLQHGETDAARTATLQRIVDQVFRAHEMIADLMFFANPPPESLEKCELLEMLRSVAESFDKELERQSIRLEISAAQGKIVAQVDPQMIGEAVRALLRNAIDAVGCQGTIVLSLVRENGQVMIHVADSGPGLSDLARSHAFDPYFSGREAGRGLGLGLCRVFRIVKLHRGEITVAGGPAGCVATITLPVDTR